MNLILEAILKRGWAGPLLTLLLAVGPTHATQLSWTNRYHGFGYGFDEVTGIVPDGAGGVYVTGGSSGPNTYYDFLTIRYAANGAGVWTNRYHGAALEREDLPAGIVADARGNVFVTGNSHGSNGYPDLLTISYTAAGVARWTNRFNGQRNRADEGTALALDAAGDVFVAGYASSLTNGEEFVTIKYSNGGIPLWTNRYGGMDVAPDRVSAMAVDGSGDVLVTGSAWSVSGPYDFTTIKYSNAGMPLWTNRHSLPSGNTVYLHPYAVATDANASVFVTGVEQGNFITFKYSSSGAGCWTNRFDGPQHHNDRAYAVRVDRSGNVIVTGAVDYNGTPDYATLQYSNDGVPRWTNYYNGPFGPDTPAQGPSALALDRHGNVYVTGTSQRTTSGIYYDYLTIMYSGTGVPIWTNRYNGTGNYEDRATAVAVDAVGNVFVAGYSEGVQAQFTYYDFATIKYGGPDLPIPLTFRVTGDRWELSWTNTGFLLQSSSEADGAYADVPGAASPFTIRPNVPRQFFRLRSR